MKFSKKTIFLGVIVVILIGLSFLFLRNIQIPNASEIPRAALGEAEDAGDTVKAGKIFSDSDKQFTLNYPPDLVVVESSPEDSVKTITFESRETRPPTRLAEATAKRAGEAGRGFEITILPFDEDGPPTPERIMEDLPDAVIKNPKNITIGDNITALAFDSTDENIGDTSEIWFVRGGYLYQAVTYREFSAELEKIVGTIEFKN